jgi:Cytidylate kinase-like family
MRTQSLSRDRAMSQIAERQMRNWALQLQSEQRRQEQTTALHELIHPFLAISRETGAEGGELAKRLSERLCWKAFDRELLDFLCERYQWTRMSLEFVDETTASWFHEMFGKWLDRQLVSQAEFVRGLGRVVLLAAQHESTIFVGRGAQFLLPRESGLAVRFISPLKKRVACVMERKLCDRREGERFIDETDSGRRDFVQRYFHHDISDPHQYDLVINLAHMTKDDAVELVVEHCRRRFPDAIPAVSQPT